MQRPNKQDKKIDHTCIRKDRVCFQQNKHNETAVKDYWVESLQHRQPTILFDMKGIVEGKEVTQTDNHHEVGRTRQ